MEDRIMSVTPRATLRYHYTSKTAKPELCMLLDTCKQHLFNTLELVHSHESSMEAMAASLRAKDALLAERDATIAVLKAEVERHASLLRKNIANQRNALNTPHKSDIQRCCAALGVKSIRPDELRAWLKDNPAT